MNLIEYFKTKYSDGIIIKGNDLLKIKNDLLELDEFSNIVDLQIILTDVNTKIETIEITENFQFPSSYPLISEIKFIPETYDNNDNNKFYENGVQISPVIYNPMNFAPYRKISLLWDVCATSKEIEKNKIISTLSHVINNIEQYLPSVIPRIYIKGFFENKRQIKLKEAINKINKNE